MNYSVFRFTLNMHNHRSQASVSAFRGDTAVRLCITLTDGGVPYYINDGCTAILSGTKADGTKLYNRCVIENNSVILYDFTEQTTSCTGVANCEIILCDEDGDVITSPKFVIVVDEREVTYDDIIESRPELNAIEGLLQATIAEQERIEAESKRQVAEDARKASEHLRNSAESARKTAETARQAAETARQEAEAERDNAIKELSDKIDNMTPSDSPGQGSEAEREVAETARQAAEAARQAAEAERETAEGTRCMHEYDRSTAETARQATEAERQLAEAVRQDNEASRCEAESDRWQAESDRWQAEYDRSMAETARQTAEAERGKAIKELSDKIDNMNTSFYFETVTSLAVVHDVPTNALGYASLDKIGGYTRACKNMLPLKPNTDLGTYEASLALDFTATTNVSLSVDKDGYLCVHNGGEIFSRCEIDLPKAIKPSGNYVVSARYMGGTVYELEAEGDLVPTLYLGDHTSMPLPTANNPFVTATLSQHEFSEILIQNCGLIDYKVAIMIEEGTTATDFEPYFEGLKSAKVRAVKSYGRNLVPPEISESEKWVIDGNWRIYTLPGVPFDGDYTLTVKKNPVMAWVIGDNISLYVSKDGGVSWESPDVWVDASMITYYEDKGPVTLSLKKGDMIRLAAYRQTGTINKIMDVQLERGSKATAYVRGGVIDVYEVPEEVQALEGYGLGISTTSNSGIDFSSKTFTKRNDIATVSHDWKWSKNSSAQNQYYANHGLSNVRGFAECYCNNFKGSSRGAYDAWGAGDNLISFANEVAWIEASKFDSADKLKEFLQANPTYAVYTLATTYPIDISQYITDTVCLRVEGGGYIVAENFEGIEAPITMTYQKAST